MFRVILFLLAVFYCVSLNCQTLKGRVEDATTGTPIAYVNVGIVGKEVGTVSDEQGYFELITNSGMAEDTLIISIIGYDYLALSVGLAARQCTDICTFKLNQRNYDLKSVEISSKSLKAKKVGIMRPGNNVKIGFAAGEEQLGVEMGMVMKVEKPSFLKQINLYGGMCYGDSIKLRINVYELTNGYPNTNLCKQPVYLNCSCEEIKKGIAINMMPYGIEVQEDFLIALEGITRKDKRDGILLKSSLSQKGTLIKRKTSQSKWTISEDSYHIGIAAILLQ